MEPVDRFDFLPFNVGDAFLVSVAQAERVVNTLDEDDFDLLLRCVDLVVLAQAFSAEAFESALDLPGDVADRMTRMLVELEILSADDMEGSRIVLSDMRDLPLILLRLNEGRIVWRTAA